MKQILLEVVQHMNALEPIELLIQQKKMQNSIALKLNTLTRN